MIMDDNYVTETVGCFNSGINANDFDAIVENAHQEILAQGFDITSDVDQIVKNKSVMETYKEKLIEGIYTGCMESGNNVYSTYEEAHNSLYEQVSTIFDNTVTDLVKESKSGQLLPITSVSFPVLIKQHLKSVLKDILQTEVTKKPVIKKYIEQTIIKHPTDPTKTWQYPQCFFNKDQYEEIFKAGKGTEINPTFATAEALQTANTGFGALAANLIGANDDSTKFEKVTPLPVFGYEVINELVPAAYRTGRDKFTIKLEIAKVQVAFVDDSGEDPVTTYKIVPLRQPININLADGMWQNGFGLDIDVLNPNTSTTDKIKASIQGHVDFLTQTTDISVANNPSNTGNVTGVVIKGFVNNDTNDRAVRFDYVRENREWKIEDGVRADYSASVEELEDIKSLSDIDMFKKTFNDISRFLVDLEDNGGILWLDEQFEKFKGVQIDPLGWDGFVTEESFDLSPQGVSSEIPATYIPKMLKFKIDRVINDIADKAKLEDMVFVVYGNPRLISLLGDKINWVSRVGSSTNGIKLDYGYGVMNSGDVKVTVVSTKKCNIKQVGTNLDGIRIIPYPINDEQFTFKHYKYSTHVLTSKESAYRDAQRPGGSYTYIIGTSRYTNAAVQGIQSKLNIVENGSYINGSTIWPY